jgi:bacterioferritin
MGQLGQKIAAPRRQPFLKELARAYADEWFAHYNYQFVAHALRGHRAPAVTTLLARKSAEAFGRANRLAERLLELGGKPPEKLTELPDHATNKPFKLPRSMSDVEAVLKAVLDAERTSIRTYEQLHDQAKEKDVVSALLLQEFLAAAVHGEEKLERLLGDEAPEMDGTG